MNLAKRKLAMAFTLTAPSTLLDAKSSISSEGNCAGFGGNDAIDQKLHDISGSRPVVLDSGFSGSPRESDSTPVIHAAFAARRTARNRRWSPPPAWPSGRDAVSVRLG